MTFKLKILQWASALFLFNNVYCQDIKIYHGQAGLTSIFRPGDDHTTFNWGNPLHIIKPQGENVQIIILNPNPLLYTYEFTMESFDIKDNFPDLTNLIDIINNIPAISAAAGPAQAFYPAAGIAAGPLKIYLDALADLRTSLQQAKGYIIQSDIPETKLDALAAAPNGGYNYAVNSIKGITGNFAELNSPTLENDLKTLLTAAKGDMSVFGTPAVAPDPEALKLIIDAFELLNKQIVEAVNSIKKSINTPGLVRIVIPVKEKNINVRLIVKKKDGNQMPVRMEFDELICTIEPEFARPLIELIPIVNVIFTKDVPNYSLRNNLISEDRTSDVSFNAGAMVLYYPITFGTHKEGSVGFGLGYNIPRKGVWQNFCAGALICYKQMFRLGFGFGFSDSPHSLKDNIQVGTPLPANIEKIDDIINYKYKPAAFINFSLSGITFKNK